VASGKLKFAGVTARATRFAFVTLSAAAGLERDPSDAVTFVDPAEIPNALPWVPGDELMVETGCDEFQDTREVISAWVPSL
jgi:hypothetical protein